MDYDLKSQTRVCQWVVYCAYPPELERQQNVVARLETRDGRYKAEKTNEHSALNREVLLLRVKSPEGRLKILPLRTELRLDLYKSKLLPGPPKTAVPELSAGARRNNLASTFSLDYDNKSFQHFLKTNKLLRRANENELNFAWRVFQYLRTKYSYHWDRSLDRRVSITCKRKNSDCAGLSYLFCAILRASKIPARPLIGRFAQTSPAVEDYSDTFACHVRSEFFVSAVGWVPVDVSDAVSNPELDSKTYFGTDPGDFIVMHENPDLVLESFFSGTKKVRSMPDYRYWLDFENKKDLPARRIIWRVQEMKTN